MNCPKCHSNSLEETGEFDLTVVDPNEARHDFKCQECGCLFQIIYNPISTMIIEEGELS